MKRLSLMFVTAFLMLFNGCRQDEEAVQPLNQPEADVYVKNGVLNFKNATILRNTFEQLIQMNEEELVEWKNTIGFNSSLHDYYEEVRRNYSGEDYFNLKDHVELYIEIPVWAVTLNQRGIVGINDSLHMFTDSIEYIVHKDKIALLDKVCENKEYLHPEIRTFKIIKKPLKVAVPKTKGARTISGKFNGSFRSSFEIEGVNSGGGGMLNPILVLLNAYTVYVGASYYLSSSLNILFWTMRIERQAFQEGNPATWEVAEARVSGRNETNFSCNNSSFSNSTGLSYDAGRITDYRILLPNSTGICNFKLITTVKPPNRATVTETFEFTE